ncbi:MAG: zinc-dependent metalloprotease [Oligoflexia bacterium]|nr:zinc-dependent metalloprotease [Oligoflexia bacterium]
MFPKALIAFGLLSVLTLSCTESRVALNRKSGTPWLKRIDVTEQSQKATVTPGQSSSPSVSVVATVDRKALLEQEFLYGVDLQYSSFYDAESELYLQSLTMGHFPVRFVIAGNELQLIMDGKYRYPSDVNHPEKLISRFKILAQTETTLTLSGADSRVFLGTVAGELGAEGPVTDHWIRSFETAENGTYLLQQTSILLPDGSVGELLESIFPRTALTPSPNFQTFEMDPEDPVGASEGAAARFRFLGGEKVYQGENAVTYAQHFDLPPGGTIDWYVTPNIPDQYLEPVKQAVEGWNRYFLAFKGIERPVMRFLGRLPEGVRLGDPRINVINWDSRRVAGAAYESQAVDPSTGKQSHSLIYLPAAWLQIGMEYWQEGIVSEPAAPKIKGSIAHVACARELRDGAALAASGRLTEEEVENFAVQLLKQTLFHELGHALGLAHNFKGSLSFDRSKPETLFSTSIMDYNDFELERAAFASVTAADGPLLEYDRQALSALYNQGRDFAEDSDALPACNDDEADQEEGGVDPLCMRYDAEKDPTLAIATAFDRITAPEKAGDVSLSAALGRVPELVLTAKKLEDTATREEFNALTSLISKSLKGAMNFYFLSAKTSLSRAVRMNIKSLLLVANGALLPGYELEAMRERAYLGVERTLALRELPAPVLTALEGAQAYALTRLAEAPFVKSLSAADAEKLLAETRAGMAKEALSFTEDVSAGLPKLRAAVLGSLVRREEVPFFLGKVGERLVDYEAAFVTILGEAVPATGNRTAAERRAAAKALSTYSGRLQGTSAIEAVRAKLLEERATATSNAARELVEELRTALE